MLKRRRIDDESNVDDLIKKAKKEDDDDDSDDESGESDESNISDDDVSDDESGDSDESSESDESIESNKQVRIFNNIVKNARILGKESMSGEATEIPILPGLYIDNYGEIPLPINKVIAQGLIKVCNTEKENLYQLDPSSVKITNPEWDEKLSLLINRVKEGLCCHGKIEATLSKIQLYTPGARFKNHTEKDTFATLVIQLPSIYDGGELVLRNLDGSKIVYDFGQKKCKSKYVPHFFAHYADVEHEILEVKKGYRLALVYSLRWVDVVGESLRNIEIKYKDMTSCLKKLNEKSVAVVLEHQYSDSSIRKNGIMALKDLDMGRYNLIMQANAKLPAEKQFSFYIAHANLVIKLGDIGGMTGNYPDWDEQDRKILINQLYDVNGNCLEGRPIEDFNGKFVTKTIDPNSKFKVDLFKKKIWGKVKDEEIDSYDGTRCVTYHKYFLILLKKNSEFDSFLREHVEYAVDYLLRNVDSDAQKESFREKIKTLIDLQKTKDYRNKLGEKQTAKMLTVIEKVGDLNLCKLFLDCISELPCKSLANCIVFFGWNALLERLGKLLRPGSHEKLSKNLGLVKELFQMQQEKIAYECLKFGVLPVLENGVEFSRNDTCVLVDVAKTILLFKGEKSDIAMEKYKCQVASVLKQESFKSLLDMIKSKVNSALLSSPFIIQLYELRYNWLLEQLKTTPKFTWVMKAITNAEPVNRFLQSEDNKPFIYANFDSISDAKIFASKFGGLKDGCSLNIKIDKNPLTVTVVKTRDYFESQVRLFSGYEKEAAFIEKILNKK